MGDPANEISPSEMQRRLVDCLYLRTPLALNNVEIINSIMHYIVRVYNNKYINFHSNPKILNRSVYKPKKY